MRYTKLLLLLLGSAAALFAADPSVGSWKMNPNKTVFQNGTSPFQQSATISETGPDLNVKVVGAAVNGTKISLSYTVPVAGGKGKIVMSSEYDGVSASRVSANELEVSYMKGGKTIYTARATVSADGKTLTVATQGVNPSGNNVTGTVVYDRQK